MRLAPGLPVRAASVCMTCQDSPPRLGVASFTALSALSVSVSYADRGIMATTVLPMAAQFDWDKSEQGLVLASFFFGYGLTQVFAGWLADRFGGRPVLCAGLAAWSLVTLITPMAADAGLAYLLAARVALGAGEGFAFPAVHSMIADGVPQSQQSKVVAAVTAASYVGASAALGLVPSIIKASGWEASFYTFGGLSCLLVPAWFICRAPKRGGGSQQGIELFPLVRHQLTPEQSPTRNGSGAAATVDEEEPPDPPPSSGSAMRDDIWADMMVLGRRPEVWAIIVTQFTQSVGMYGMLNWLPSYYHDVYGIEVGELAVFTVTPYVLQGVVGVASGVLADHLINDKGWGIKITRQVLQGVGMAAPAFSLLLATQLPEMQVSTGAALLAVGSGLSALTLGGVSVNHLDVARSRAGLVFGAGNTAATVAGLLSVPASGWILDQTNSYGGVFTMFACSYLIGAAVFIAYVGDKEIPQYSRAQQ